MIKNGPSPNRMQGNLFFLVLLILSSTALISCETVPNEAVIDVATDQQAIRELLMNQQTDWNDGDIRAFMSAYLTSDSLRFASAGSYRFGWQATLDRYLTVYPDRDAMGQLTFSVLDIDVLSDEWALVFGSWELNRGGTYENIGGLFTLVLVRTEAGWRIKYDHTSSRS